MTAGLPFNVGSIMERVIAANPQNGSKSDNNEDSEGEEEASPASEPAAVAEHGKAVDTQELPPAGEEAPPTPDKASTTSLTKELPGKADSLVLVSLGA